MTVLPADLAFRAAAPSTRSESERTPLGTLAPPAARIGQAQIMDVDLLRATGDAHLRNVA
jgi:hypothetical protein